MLFIFGCIFAFALIWFGSEEEPLAEYSERMAKRKRKPLLRQQ